jgi:hypothetical protein
MSLLAAGKIVAGSLVASIPSREIASALPYPIISKLALFGFVGALASKDM